MRGHKINTVERMNLRKYAQGKPCRIRLPGCDGGGETTVLAHYRSTRFCGIAQKPIDLLGAHACANCHDIADGRQNLSGWSRDEIRMAHMQGVMETIDSLYREGWI